MAADATSNACADKESCKNVSKPLECLGYNSKTKKEETQIIDETMFRQSLTDKGNVRLTDDDPNYLSYERYYSEPSHVVECSFKEQEMTLFELCRNVVEDIDSNIYGGKMYDDETEEGELVPLNEHLQRSYGVSKRISSRQFMRSLFLIIAQEEKKRKLEDRSAAKKARIVTPSQQVTIGMAKSEIAIQRGRYSRMKKIIRFYLADDDPKEICLESRRGCRWH